MESIGRAKTTQLNLTGMIYIYIVTSQLRTTAPRDCHSSAQLRPPPKGFAVQGHCLQVRLHGSRGGVFIGHRPPRDPGGPLQIRSFTSIQMVHTHTQTPDAFTHRRFYTQTPVHTDTFAHKSFYTQTLLHTNTFTHRRFYTQTLLHRDAFAHRRLYTQML